MPVTLHPVAIKVYGIDNAPVSEATVTLTVSSGSTSATSNTSGEIVLNVADAGSWDVGDEATIVASKTGSGTKTETLTLTAAPQRLDITLEETSDLSYQDMGVDNAYVLNFCIITTYDGEKVTHSNPLPVKVVDENGVNSNRRLITARAYNSNNQIVYQGFALPGTGKGEAKWQITKKTYSGNKPTDDTFAGGSDAFDKIWNNRANYNYS